ncbi:uncharacterized protein LOC141640750 [Silene latifolia]|uniref:uncharacterized protein LOC141640750 n=1 Tax=Silene latifolia TaxID=37657 RepID=UPI003D7746FD
MANFAKATQQEQANLRATFLKDMREMESRMASHAMANPQRPPGGLLAQGQSSKDDSNSHHAHAVVLRSGVELEDTYKDLVVEVDEDPKGNKLEMNGEEEISPIEPMGKASEDNKGKKACEDLSRRVIQEDKDVDGYVEDLPYEEEAIEEAPLQHSKKVTKNLAPPKVAKKIGIQNLAPTSMTLQLADRSVKHPMRVLEDIPVKVGKLLIPTDFVVLDIPEDSHTPIILSRPFLATGGVLIDVKNGRLTFQIEGNDIEFNLPNLMKGPKMERLSTIELVDEVVHEVAREEAEMEEVFKISLHDEAMKEDHEVDEELVKKVEGFLPPKDFLEKSMEVFMDDFSVHGDSFDHGLENLTSVLKRCEEHNLVLNWEKCHFMVEEGVVLGHVVSSRGIEVDGAKVAVIENLSPPSNVKGVRSFLGHAGFYRRFIKDFSKIAKPLTSLLLKDAPFVFDEFCLEAFHRLKRALVTAPIIRAPGWGLPFEIMCDASDFAVGAVLGQMVDRKNHVIYYTSKTLDQTQCGYSTTEKEMLAIVHAVENFRQYLVGSKVVVYSDHTALRQLMVKKDAKPRLLRWVLLLQEFDLEIKDKPRSENLVADHLSRLTKESRGDKDDGVPIDEWLSDDSILAITHSTPWYADIANFLSSSFIPEEFDNQARKKLRYESKRYVWEDPYLYRRCNDGIYRRCVSQEEGRAILQACHATTYEGTCPHLGPKLGFFIVASIDPLYSKMHMPWYTLVILVKEEVTLEREMRCR